MLPMTVDLRALIEAQLAAMKSTRTSDRHRLSSLRDRRRGLDPAVLTFVAGLLALLPTFEALGSVSSNRRFRPGQ